MSEYLNKLFQTERQLNSANNSQGSLALYYNRLFFELYGYTNFPSYLDEYSKILPLRDFRIGENYLYGRIDTDFFAISPKKTSLRVLSDDNNNVAHHRAAISFQNLVQEIKEDVTSGNIPDNIPFISNMKSHKSFEDINVTYNEWVNDVIELPFSRYVRKFGKEEKIVDFKSFMIVFKEHLKMIAEQLGVVNFSSFCVSTKTNVRNSGLSIEIADLDFSKDQDKIIFSQNPYFNYYLKKAEKFGFYVDYNAPWRLIYNLGSPANVSESSWDGLRNFFTNNYNKAYKSDLDILKNVSFNTYRAYIGETPSLIVEKVDEKSGCLVKKFISRTAMSKEQFEEEYSDEYWLDCYINLKRAEKNLNFDANEMQRIKNTAFDYKKYVDIDRAMSYINSVFQDIPSLEGSYYNESVRRKYADQDQTSFEDFDKYINEIVRSHKEK